MTDIASTLVTPEMMRQFGADAFDKGLSIDDHGMNPWVNAVVDWRKGWQERRAQVCADQLLVLAMGMCPP
jgi:hypothetical protein